MKYFAIAMTAGLLTLASTANAPAQTIGSPYYGTPNVYVQPSYQPVYPAPVYVQPQVGPSISFATPSFGFGINLGSSYGPSIGVYPRPVYVPSYYPQRYNHHHGHYHHYR